ncbi:MAG: ABC transporter ATP-binding protein [Clostridiales bacterium]|nr:ABC transporter ATP-binding protein [Clostridiales bacterium]
MYIELENISKTYGKNETAVRALNHANFSLESGEVCVILGPSGSGKSTLLNLLGGLCTPDSGRLTVGDKIVSQMNKNELTDYRREYVGFVFQSYNLIPDLTVRENIEVVADISASPISADEIMDALDITQYQYRFPRELSGGQQQRTAIARAMVKNPKLLLCDELTGALDTKASKSVLVYIEKMNRRFGTTVIIITHNEKIAAMADVIIRLRDGVIVDKITKNEKISAENLTL